MAQPTVPEPSVWADIAAELRSIANDVDDLIGQPAPGCFDIDIHPLRISYPPAPKDRAATVEGIDTVALVLLGKKAETKPMSGGTFHHTVKGRRGPITLSIYNAVADPSAVDTDEELARLRAENAQLRAAAGLDHSRADDGEDPQPVAGRAPAHWGDAVSAIDERDGHRDGEPVITGEVDGPKGWHRKGCHGATGLPCTCEPTHCGCGGELHEGVCVSCGSAVRAVASDS